MKLAHFSPLPPQKSGIADYCAALLPHLAAHMSVDAFTDANVAPNPQWQPASQFTAYQRFDYDLCLYHMGNNRRFHSNIYQTMRRFPSVVVLHEFNLYGFHLHGPRTDLIREMGYAYGEEGVAAIYRLYDGSRSQPERYPLFERLVALNRGIIVHTNYARQTILNAFPQAKVAVVPLAAPPKQTPSGPKPALLANLPADTLLLGSFGYLSPSKRLTEILQALAQIREQVPQLRYLLVGDPVQNYALTPLIDELGLRDLVIETGFVAPADYAHYLDAVDIALNLRTGPTGGEMSASLLQLLAQGKPTLVSNVGGFADFPDETVVKIQQDEGEIGELTAVLTQLLTKPTLRHQIGTAGRTFVEQHCTLSQVAQQIYEFLSELMKEGGA
ncbi:MAG: glycosyltransferase family 4 protein [Chloroflexota bacterium]